MTYDDDDEPGPPPMTLATFRARSRFVPWIEAEQEHFEAPQTYEHSAEKPEGLMVYPCGCWIARMALDRFELHLEREDYSGPLADLEPILHGWAVWECELLESDPIEADDDGGAR